MTTMTKWPQKFAALCETIASWSKDRSRKTSCIIVGPANDIRAMGYNGFPRGVDDTIEDRHARPAKYWWTEHAERNAIYNAARAGVSLDGCTAFMLWYPCADCARALIQVGIKVLWCVEPNWDDPSYKDSFDVVPQMLREAGIVVWYYDDREAPAQK